MMFPWSRRRDRELDDELRAHLRMAVEERVARGERREDAELAARREFGNLGVVQEVTREMRGGGWRPPRLSPGTGRACGTGSGTGRPP